MEKMERRKMLERGKREDKRSWGGEEDQYSKLTVDLLQRNRDQMLAAQG